MVCTDAAARGLDIPDIRQVIQADFASSAVDYLHRVRPDSDVAGVCCCICKVQAAQMQ